MFKSSFFILIGVLFLGSSCGISKKAVTQPKKVETTAPISYQFPYDLEQADVAFDLPKSLEEISGIAFSEGNKEILAIQDENGILFYIDKATGAITKERKFHKDGDYEDLEVVGDDIYVIKSSGVLYQLKDTAVDTFIRIKHKIGYHKEHDIEGMCLDKKNNRLLLACKGKLSRDKEYGVRKGMFAFDLSTMEMIEEPVLTISLEDLESYMSTKGSPELREDFAKVMQENDGVLGFSPSAVAINPLTEHIYMISSKGKTLVVMTPEGHILHLQKLNKKVHEQPEGMLFDTDGTLYISNEGKEQNAKIYRFNLKK